MVLLKVKTPLSQTIPFFNLFQIQHDTGNASDFLAEWLAIGGSTPPFWSRPVHTHIILLLLSPYFIRLSPFSIDVHQVLVVQILLFLGREFSYWFFRSGMREWCISSRKSNDPSNPQSHPGSTFSTSSRLGWWIWWIPRGSDRYRPELLDKITMQERWSGSSDGREWKVGGRATDPEDPVSKSRFN